MRYSVLAVALAAAVTSLGVNAQSADSQELAALKQQLADLQAKVLELEERTDAQSAVNVDTAEALDKATVGATKVETKGGIKVTSADGNFEANVGGRIHFDGYLFDRDLANTTGTTEFRRTRLTLSGKAFGWEYKVENDFSGSSPTDGYRDVFIAKSALGGKFTIGHFKPYRSMEELTSSNEITMMERPFASATGIYNGRQFAQGIGYLRSGGNYTVGVTGFNLRNAAGPRNEGVGASARVTFAPINNETSTLHFGVSGSTENLNKDSATVTAVANYAGRRGPSQTIATTTAASGDSVETVGLEFAGAFGPAFFQSEYANATFNAPLGRDSEVETYYVMGSYMLNGGHRVYKPATGVFGAPKVTDKRLWELTARYDSIENKDVAGLEATSTTLGLNYYINPNVRLMFNYTQGENEVTGDETGQYAVRTQFSF